MLASDLRHGVLRRLLEWLVELEHDWSLRPGAYGRGLERHLPGELVRELAATYERAAAPEAFDRTIDLFRRVARAVAEGLGYAYPQRLDDLASERLGEVGRCRRGEAAGFPGRGQAERSTRCYTSATTFHRFGEMGLRAHFL